MQPLEFDVLGQSFADGFSRALTDLFGHEVMVGVRLRDGNLDVVKIVDTSTVAGTAICRTFDYLDAWRNIARPAMEGQLRCIRALGWGAVSTADAASALDEATSRMTYVTYVHHTLVLPARLKLVEFAEFAQAHGIVDTTMDAMCMLAGRPNATTAMAESLWSHRTAPTGLTGLPQEGDGYGLAIPGWLEDSSVPSSITELYGRLDESVRPSQLMIAARREAARLEGRARDVLSGLRVSVQDDFELLWSSARAAISITEEHAPLMHARLPFELRALVLRLGTALVRAGRLSSVDDIFSLHTSELVGETDRAVGYEYPVVRPQGHRGAAEEGKDRRDARDLFESLFGASPKTHRTDSRCGHPASPGRARGAVRRVRRQSDVGTVGVGDVLVTPDSGSGWSYLLPAAAAVVAESGHPYGHLASLARDYSKPAIVGVGDTADVLPTGQVVDVDGAAGVVRLIGGDDDGSA